MKTRDLTGAALDQTDRQRAEQEDLIAGVEYV